MSYAANLFYKKLFLFRIELLHHYMGSFFDMIALNFNLSRCLFITLNCSDLSLPVGDYTYSIKQDILGHVIFSFSLNLRVI